MFIFVVERSFETINDVLQPKKCIFPSNLLVEQCGFGETAIGLGMPPPLQVARHEGQLPVRFENNSVLIMGKEELPIIVSDFPNDFWYFITLSYGRRRRGRR